MEDQPIIVTTQAALARIVEEAMRSALKSPEIFEHGGKRLLSGKEVEKEYGIGKRTLEQWRAEGAGPEYSNVGGRIMYERSKLEKFIAAGRVRPAHMSGVKR
jgi:hypothetical protein